MIIEAITSDPRWQLRTLADNYAPAIRETSFAFQQAAVALLEDLSVDEVSRKLGLEPATLRAWQERLK